MTAAATAVAVRSSRDLTGYALAILGVLAFSTRSIMVRLGYAEGADAETLLGLRMALSLPFFVGMVAWGGWRARGGPVLRPADWAAVIGLGVLGYYLASYLDFLGLRSVPAGPGRLILFIYPTFTLMLSALFLGKRPGGREIGCLAVAYAGLVLVLGGDVSLGQPGFALGAGLILLSAVAYAGYLVGSSAVVQRVGSLRFTGIAMIAASIACIAQFFVVAPAETLLEVSPRLWGIAGWMAIVGTVLPVWATAEALKRIGANRAAILGALGPVATIAMAWLGLDEAMTGLQVAGALLVLGGVGLLTLRRGR